MTISLVFKLFDFVLNKGAVRCDNFIYIGLFDKYKNMEILKVQGNKSSRHGRSFLWMWNPLELPGSHISIQLS